MLFPLCFKASLGAQSFIWKWVVLAPLLSWTSNIFTYERLSTKTCFEKEGKGDSEMACCLMLKFRYGAILKWVLNRTLVFEQVLKERSLPEKGFENPMVLDVQQTRNNDPLIFQLFLKGWKLFQEILTPLSLLWKLFGFTPSRNWRTWCKTMLSDALKPCKDFSLYMWNAFYMLVCSFLVFFFFSEKMKQGQ